MTALTSESSGVRPPCSIADCAKPTEGSGLCAMHRKRLQRLRRGIGRRPVAAPPAREGLTPLEAVIVTGSDFLEAESDEEYRLALRSFRKACAAWMASNGWRPPAALQDADNAEASAPHRPALELVQSPGPNLIALDR